MAKGRVVLLLVVILFIAVVLYAYHWDNEPRYKEQQSINFDPHIPALKLSVDTANPFVNVSDDLLSAERVKAKLPYPAHPARFINRPQVLTTQCVSSGSHYWELEAEDYWEIAVAYSDISREGSLSSFGMNKESWSLTHKDGKLFAFHNGEKSELSKSLRYRRVAVTVGVQEGTVIFYEVGTKLKQLHMFTPQLSQPVCLGIGLYRASKITILKTYEVHRV